MKSTGQVGLLTRTFSPSDDAYVSEKYPNMNHGSLNLLEVCSYQGSDERTYIKFDLSNIPPGSVIESATLKLYMFTAPTSTRTMRCRLAGRDWSESSITWSNQPYLAGVVASVSVGTSAGWISLDLTASVQSFVRNRDPVSNYGWILMDANEGSTTAYMWRMRSKEYTDSTQRPYLQVRYYPPHLELSLSSSTVEAGSWVRVTVYRKTQNNEPVTRGALKIKMSSSSTSTNKKFSLSQGGAAITELTIPDGSDHVDFYYYDEKAGTWSIKVWTEDYMYIVWTGGIPNIPIIVANYGDDTKELTVTPGPLDHFEFASISSPKQVAVPFSITITAYDAYGNVKTDYTGTNSLSDTTGTINPTITGAFVNGRWTGMVTISRIGSNIKITTSGAGKSGESNAFEVRAGPPAKLAITPSSFTMAAGVAYSYLNITLKDANDYETTHASDILVSLSTTSPDGEFRQFGTTTKITSVTIPAGSSSVKVDYYDIRGGTHTLTASATGLASGTATVTVIPDTTPPVTTITIGSPKYLSGAITFVSGSTVFELSASDDASGVKETRYRIDGGSWNSYTTGFTLSTLSDGSHTIGYCSIDKADNNEAEKTITIILDKTPPAISGASPTGSLILGSTSVRFTVRVEDTGSGVKEVRLTVDGVSQGNMSGGGEYSKTVSLSEGSHTWSIEAVDNLDNAETWSGSFTLAVDTAPPTVSDLSAPASPAFGEQITITCTVSDALSGVEEVTLYYSTNGGASWTEVAMTLQAGRYVGTIPSQAPFTNVQYYVEAVDRAGNRHQTPVSTLSVGIPLWIYIVILVIIIIIVVAVLLLRRRKPTPPPPPP
ncbi:MAG: DNRLRE domain-containing protein [Candidatus Brockarchaeota archaeon]|nr:DNRLRE domain-containing protein [Candidatus Brockarchaeota archaeon]